MSDSLQLYGLEPTRFLHPWDSPGKSTGVGFYFPLQERASLAGLYLLLAVSGYLYGPPGCDPYLLLSGQTLKRPPSLGSFSRVSCQHRLVERERLQGWLQPLHVTQHYLLASVVARISSKGISHNDLLPHAPHVVSSQATADLSLGLLSSLYAPAPAAMCSRALASLSRV